MLAEINDELFNTLINLDTFSRLPPNTDVMLNNDGYFVVTANKYAHLPGAQTIVNMLNKLTPATMLSDLDNYFTKVAKLCERLYYHNLNHKVILLAQYLELAYGDDTAGLCSLLKTYETHDIYQSFFESVYYLKNTVDNYVELVNINETIVSPTARFNKSDWQQFMHMSLKLQCETTTLYKYYIKYSGNLLYNQIATALDLYHWYDLIHIVNNSKIYLGAMPIVTKYKNDLDDLNTLNIDAVLSVVECFENKSDGFITHPVPPTEWKQWGIWCLQLPICDFQDIDMQKLQIGAEFIHFVISEGKNIYISCRAGKQRSTTVLMAYMIKYLKFTVEDAFAYVRTKRPQVKNDHHALLKKYQNML